MTPGLAYTGLSKTRKNLPGLETLDRQDPFLACTFLTKPNHTDMDMQDWLCRGGNFTYRI